MTYEDFLKIGQTPDVSRFSSKRPEEPTKTWNLKEANLSREMENLGMLQDELADLEAINLPKYDSRMEVLREMLYPSMRMEEQADFTVPPLTKKVPNVISERPRDTDPLMDFLHKESEAERRKPKSAYEPYVDYDPKMVLE